MDVTPYPLAASPAASAALPQAEAAASAVETSGVMTRAPEMPIPFPATQAQAGEVNKSRMVDSAVADLAPERVLKPWGLPMLPDLAKQAETPDAEEEPTDETASADAPAKDAARETKEGAAPSEAAVVSPEDPAQPARDPFATEPETT